MTGADGSSNLVHARRASGCVVSRRPRPNEKGGFPMTKTIQTWVVTACLVGLGGCSSSAFHTGEELDGGGELDGGDGGVTETETEIDGEVSTCPNDSLIICGGPCPEGRYHHEWLVDRCDGGLYLWDCQPLCGTRIVRCIVSSEPCPDGWVAVQPVHTNLCGPQTPTNAWVCEPQKS